MTHFVMVLLVVSPWIVRWLGLSRRYLLFFWEIKVQSRYMGTDQSNSPTMSLDVSIICRLVFYTSGTYILGRSIQILSTVPTFL